MAGGRTLPPLVRWQRVRVVRQAGLAAEGLCVAAATQPGSCPWLLQQAWSKLCAAPCQAFQASARAQASCALLADVLLQDKTCCRPGEASAPCRIGLP